MLITKRNESLVSIKMLKYIYGKVCSLMTVYVTDNFV